MTPLNPKLVIFTHLFSIWVQGWIDNNQSYDKPKSKNFILCLNVFLQRTCLTFSTCRLWPLIGWQNVRIDLFSLAEQFLVTEQLQYSTGKPFCTPNRVQYFPLFYGLGRNTESFNKEAPIHLFCYSASTYAIEWNHSSPFLGCVRSLVEKLTQILQGEV